MKMAIFIAQAISIHFPGDTSLKVLLIQFFENCFLFTHERVWASLLYGDYFEETGHLYFMAL
mgnify:CR=1 FL=1